MPKKFRNTVKPKYEPEEWEKFMEAGCYPYCLNLKINKFFVVGELIGKKCDTHVSNEYLIETLKQEIEEIFNFEIEEVETEYQTTENEFKIYLQRVLHTGHYHFLREDYDGFWSHKFPKELPCRVDSYGNLIEDPDAMVEASFEGWCFKLKKK